MHDIVTLRRQHTEWVIRQNPVTITINRTEKASQGGGFGEVKSEVGPLTVRIFQQASGVPQEVSTLAGVKLVDGAWGLLADSEADVRAGANVQDEFEVPGLGRFRVVGVYAQVMRGKPVGYQAVLERVG